MYIKAVQAHDNNSVTFGPWDEIRLSNEGDRFEVIRRGDPEEQDIILIWEMVESESGAEKRVYLVNIRIEQNP